MNKLLGLLVLLCLGSTPALGQFPLEPPRHALSLGYFVSTPWLTSVASYQFRSEHWMLGAGLSWKITPTEYNPFQSLVSRQRLGGTTFVGYRLPLQWHDVVFVPGIHLFYRHGQYGRPLTQHFLLGTAAMRIERNWQRLGFYGQVGYGVLTTWGQSDDSDLFDTLETPNPVNIPFQWLERRGTAQAGLYVYLPGS